VHFGLHGEGRVEDKGESERERERERERGDFERLNCKLIQLRERDFLKFW
jgi:hypothetical protein